MVSVPHPVPVVRSDVVMVTAPHESSNVINEVVAAGIFSIHPYTPPFWEGLIKSKLHAGLEVKASNSLEAMLFPGIHIKTKMGTCSNSHLARRQQEAI